MFEYKVYTKEFGYIELKDIKEDCTILLDTNEFSELSLEKLEGIFPVLDMQIDDNENYICNWGQTPKIMNVAKGKNALRCKLIEKDKK